MMKDIARCRINGCTLKERCKRYITAEETYVGRIIMFCFSTDEENKNIECDFFIKK